MNLHTIPPGAPFLDTLATWWLGQPPTAPETPNALFLLPTRRAARALADAFLRAADGRPLLLPRITAIGALDEAPLTLAGALDLPPPVPEPLRLAALSRLIIQLDGNFGAPTTADRAWPLAAELARLLDEAHREGATLAETLPTLVDEGFARHWADTLHFLQIVTAHWPGILAGMGMLDPADRHVRLLEVQTRAWQTTPPDHPIVIAGTTGGIRAMATLMRTVAHLPQGHVILPGLDLQMDEETWSILEDSHPQAALKTLLADMHATRADTRPWPPSHPEAVTANQAAQPNHPSSAQAQPAQPRTNTNTVMVGLDPTIHAVPPAPAVTAAAPPSPAPANPPATAEAPPSTVMARPVPAIHVVEPDHPSTAKAHQTATPQAQPLITKHPIIVGLDPTIATTPPDGDTHAAPPPHAITHPTRPQTIWRSLLPAPALTQWRTPTTPDTKGLERLDPADQQEEALAIALILREALESPNAQAALVTPDRTLAARVAAELARFGITTDDSAGEALSETPPGAFLRLIAQAVAQDLAPVPLLGLLKHPLAALGLPPAACRRLARRLERKLLRGPAPPPGLEGLRARLAQTTDETLAPFIGRLESCLAPLTALTRHSTLPPAQAMSALIQAAERCAGTDTTPGPTRLWALEEGEALAQHLTALLEALPTLPPQPTRTLPTLLDATLYNATVRTRRALRGRPGHEHPRIAILGLLEARLQSFDVLVLGSLAEAVWPPAADPGPWMSRPMRRAAGLASPESAIGQMAHDFAMLACAAPRVILSCPRRRDGAPTVPARWLVRLEAFLKGHGAALARSPAADWARQLDQPENQPTPVAPPRPTPPVAARPRTLSVTEIETWLRDPYAIHARHILGLRPLDDLDQAVENADYGSIVHDAIAAWVPALPETWPHDAAARLRAEMDRALDARPIRPALAAWWRPRLARIADWVAIAEQARRIAAPRAIRGIEANGTWTLEAPAGPFTLRGRADRIETLPDGRLALLDYKTGIVPTNADVVAGRAPQLPLEAAMAQAGAFGPHLTGTAAELTYWRLTGGYVPGEATPLAKNDPTHIAALTAQAATSLEALVATFDTEAQPYLSHPHPKSAPRFPHYAHLARVAEWSAAEEDQ